MNLHFDSVIIRYTLYILWLKQLLFIRNENPPIVSSTEAYYVYRNGSRLVQRCRLSQALKNTVQSGVERSTDLLTEQP